jgi:hypothetical protein
MSPVAVFHSSLPAPELRNRLLSVLSERMRTESLDPLRPTESRIIVRAEPTAVVLQAFATQGVYGRLDVVVEVRPASEGGSTARARREPRLRRSRLGQLIGLLLLAMLVIPPLRVLLTDGNALWTLVAYVPFAGVAFLALVVVPFAISRPRAEAEVARLEQLVESTVRAARQELGATT